MPAQFVAAYPAQGLLWHTRAQTENTWQRKDRLRVKMISRVSFGRVWGMSRVARILASGLLDAQPTVPWWQGRRLRLEIR